MTKDEASSKPGKGSHGIEKLDKGGLGPPLYEPEDGKANVDIVFVHGINGDRIDTWTYKDKNGDKMWPKDFLPEKLPNARIVSFGYTADLAGFYPGKPAPELTVDDYSISLLESVREMRQGEEVERPIIFVAHSMGGHVVANALSRGLKSNKALQSIPDHTIGALFLGTSFHGPSVASYGLLAFNLFKYIMRTETDSIEMLEKKSKKLADINTQFTKFLKYRDLVNDMPCLNIACFFENLPIAGTAFVVPEDSTTWLGVDPQFIDADMCRFNHRERQGFRNVSDKLVQWIKGYETNKKAGGVAGLDLQEINISGNVDYKNAHLYKSSTTGHAVRTTVDTVRIALDRVPEMISHLFHRPGPGQSTARQQDQPEESSPNTSFSESFSDSYFSEDSLDDYHYVFWWAEAKVIGTTYPVLRPLSYKTDLQCVQRGEYLDFQAIKRLLGVFQVTIDL